MEMPLFLPKEMDVYRSAKDDVELCGLLVKNKKDLLRFVEYAAEHETWSEEHAEFMRMALDWLTRSFFQNRLLTEDAARIAKKIQEHFSVLSGYLPRNIAFDVSGVTFSANSLMFGAASPQIQELILHETRDRGRQVMKLSHVEPAVFRTIEEFVMTGDVADLWKMQEEQLINIHRQATYWGLPGLAFKTESFLARYLMRGNVLEKLIEAHVNNWPVLRQACYTFINQLDLGCRLHETQEEHVAFEFLDYREPALTLFDKLSSIITHLIFRKNLIEDATFRSIVRRCPALIGLDIAESASYDDNLQMVPQSIEELDISSCTWLNPEHFPLLAAAFPNLKKLIIQNNIQLNYTSWAQIGLFSHLIYMDISRNSQIGDEDFKIILQGVPQLTDLRMDDCRGVTDRGFFELTRLLPRLTILSVERGEISPGILMELAQRCRSLTELNISRCPLLAEQGTIDAVKQIRPEIHLR